MAAKALTATRSARAMQRLPAHFLAPTARCPHASMARSHGPQLRCLRLVDGLESSRGNRTAMRSHVGAGPGGRGGDPAERGGAGVGPRLGILATWRGWERFETVGAGSVGKNGVEAAFYTSNDVFCCATREERRMLDVKSPSTSS